MVSWLEEWIMNESEMEVVEIAEQVHSIKLYSLFSDKRLILWQALKDVVHCQSQWHQGLEEGYSWLDYSTWPIPCASHIKIDHSFNHKWTGSLLCPAGLNWSDPEWVFTDLIPQSYHNLFACRIKATLKSGELQVSRDQWTIFIYSHCEYDPEDLWKGTFQDALLILVCYIFISH